MKGIHHLGPGSLPTAVSLRESCDGKISCGLRQEPYGISGHPTVPLRSAREWRVRLKAAPPLFQPLRDAPLSSGEPQALSNTPLTEIILVSATPK